MDRVAPSPPASSACASPLQTLLRDSPSLRALLLCTCVMAMLAVDQASKVHAMQHWRATAERPIEFAAGILRIQYAENPGAFLSLLGGLDPSVRFWLLTVGNGAILLIVAGCLLRGMPADLWSWIALAIILAGGIGNLIDRMRFDSHVIDFLVMTSGPLTLPGLGQLRTGIFNVADIGITAGFLMLLPIMFRPSQEPQSGSGS